MKVVVLGAGVVGTASAWYLAKAGHEVTVLDRQPDAAMETSFANGGQISASHAEPWANPGAPRKILKWLAREDAPLLFRFRADRAQWQWGLSFLAECLPGRTRRNTAQILALTTYGREQLRALRAETGIEYDQLERGILHVYTDPVEFEAAVRASALEGGRGERRILTPGECVALEPALKSCTLDILGGAYTESDESGDACKFTQLLARRCAERGVTFRYDATILRLAADAGRIAGVVVASGGATESIAADAYVMSLGSYSPLLLRGLGISVPVYPAKGYSITIPNADPAGAPTVSITDDAAKIVISRLGNRLRAAGTAELNGYDTSINRVRCEAIVQRTFALFPNAGSRANIEVWAGLRPATPSNVPLVGRTRYPNLFLNTGHGTLGWTMSCGSGRAIADIVSGVKPGVRFAFREG